MSYNPYRFFISLIVFTLVSFASFYSLHAQESIEQSADSPIRIGSGSTIEQVLMEKMIVQLLRENGYNVVEDIPSIGDSLAARKAIEEGTIDLYPEYTGRTLTNFMGLPVNALPDDASRISELAKILDERNGYVWLLGNQVWNRYTMMVSSQFADGTVTNIPDLAQYLLEHPVDDITVCVDNQFDQRTDGLPWYKEMYGDAIDAANIQIVNSSELLTAIIDNRCDVVQHFSLSSFDSTSDYRQLDDPDGLFPVYELAPVLRQELVEQYPELPSLLDKLLSVLDSEQMISLRMDVISGQDYILNSGDELSIEDAVNRFLVTHRLLKTQAIKVGSKQSIEQVLLGKIIIALLRDAGLEVDDMTGFGDSTETRRALEAGTIDIYPEYTMLAASLYNSLPLTTLPADTERGYLLIQGLDEYHQGLTWLEPAVINPGHRLFIRKASMHGTVHTLEDLATMNDAEGDKVVVCVEEGIVSSDVAVYLQDRYGIRSDDDGIRLLDSESLSIELANGECDLVEGTLDIDSLQVQDTSVGGSEFAVFPEQLLAPVIRQDILEENPSLGTLLNSLMSTLDVETMNAIRIQGNALGDDILDDGNNELLDDIAFSILRAKRLVTLPSISVGNADSAEGSQLVLAQMIMLTLQEAGYNVIDKTDLGSDTLVRQAMLDGEVDLYLETVAGALSTHNNLPVAAWPKDRARAYKLVSSLDSNLGITWLNPLEFSQPMSIIGQATAEELGIASIDELAQYMNENDSPLFACMTNEFFSNESSGLSMLESTYGFKIRPENILLKDMHEVYDELGAGSCHIAIASASNAEQLGYPLLDDPLNFFLTFGSAPVVRTEVLAENTELADLLNDLMAVVDENVIDELDHAVEFGEDNQEENGDEPMPVEVARDFLLSLGLISQATADSAVVLE